MEPETNSSTTKSNYSIPAAIVLAGVIIGGALYFSNSKPVATGPAPVAKIEINTAGEPFIGDPNAPVTIALWFDYQCPACQYNEENLMPSLVTDYVKTGKVRIVFKDFAFLGPDSQTLAVTARAIWEAYPDKYYSWHKTIFDNQGQENSGWATKEVIVNLTKKVAGIDQAVIDGLVAKNSATYQQAIDADKTEAGALGVNATPSFMIFTAASVATAQPIAGVPQYARLQSIIDPLIK